MNGLLAGDDDVHPAVLEALQHLGDPRRAADPVGGAVVVAEHDSERLGGLEAVADHALVAVLEDVKRQELARQDHHRELEDRQLDPSSAMAPF